MAGAKRRADANRLLRWPWLAAAVSLLVLLVVLAPTRRTVERWLVAQPYGPELHWWWLELRMPPLSPRDAGHGGPATEIQLFDPVGLAQDASGHVYLSDRGRATRGRYIWQIESDGSARVLAGTGRRGSPAAGAAAVDAALGSPEGVAVDAAGRLYFADSWNHVVMRVDTDGRLTRIAGNGEPGDGGDGGPASEAQLRQPYDVRLDAQGNLYIADFGNHRVRLVSSGGVIRTAAGTGEPGYTGGGGPAPLAQLNGPYGVFIAPDGELVIADSLNHVIRRVDGAGAIHTIAGTGVAGHSGDGGAAVRAGLDTPQALWVDRFGRVFIGDEHNHAIRVVGADGRIDTWMGNGSPGQAAPGANARTAPLNDPENLLLRSDGSLLVTDGDNRRVLRVNPEGTVEIFAGRGAAPSDPPGSE